MEDYKNIDKALELAVLNLGIPPCPKILIDLTAEARKEEPNYHYIEKLISADVGLSAALIKTINSPFYGIRNKVSSVIQAVHLLGLAHLSLMVMGMALRNVLKMEGQVEMERFWDGSGKVAIISSYIAGRLPYISYEHMRRTIDKDEAYTFGLFQDCGIPIMLSQHAHYKDTLKRANSNSEQKFTDIEDLEFGQNHAKIGQVLAQSWGLPESMYQAIRCHHEHAALSNNTCQLSDQSKDYIALTLLAERAIQVITGLSQTSEWPKGREWVMQHFGITDNDFVAIINGIQILYDEGSLNI
jgi:HD-like signal output (HDOD) protein